MPDLEKEDLWPDWEAHAAEAQRTNEARTGEMTSLARASLSSLPGNAGVRTLALASATQPSELVPGCGITGSWQLLSTQGWATQRPILPRDGIRGRYLAQLDALITGVDGVGLPGFLETVLVGSQCLAARHLANGCDGGLVYSPPPFTRYLPGTVPVLLGGGDHRRVFCPFHGEQTPSHAYSMTSRLWHCYGCGAHGTHWSLASKAMELGDRQAVDFLRRLVGMPPPPWQLQAPRRNPVLTVYGYLIPKVYPQERSG